MSDSKREVDITANHKKMSKTKLPDEENEGDQNSFK